jgi:hypothetical protein
VGFYYAKPKAHVNTTVKGWMSDPANIRYDERVEITRGLKRDNGSAGILLNLSTKTVERNRFGDNKSFDELFKYFFTGYHQYVTTVMTQLDAEYFNRMLDEMQAELDKNQEDSASEEVAAQ